MTAPELDGSGTRCEECPHRQVCALAGACRYRAIAGALDRDPEFRAALRDVAEAGLGFLESLRRERQP